MICFNCGIKLHSNDLKECQLCSAKFATKCPSCEFPNALMAKYCFNCGTQIVKTDSESSVKNFDTLSESRRNVAVVFADISGFTALSEKMDPEEVREIINDCFDYITKPVYELEGTIDKYMGDCVMILFGAKYTHSDDARRAVLCAMKMMTLVKSFSDERLSGKNFSLTLSIGINYGLVVTGSVGNYFDKDYTVMGDIVNTAQRLQSSAEKGIILVSESVYMETRDAVRYSETREVTVKNKENPVRCYSPVELNPLYSSGNEVPFIGRESEIYRLNSIYNNILNTSTQYITIIGEGGIGKTRLISQFVSKILSDIKVVRVDCSSTSHSRGYYVIASILMNVMNINPEDTGSVKQNRLMSFLDFILDRYSDEEKRRNYHFLALVLGLGRDNEFQDILNSMTFDNIKKEILKQLFVFFTNLFKKYRMIIIVDDIHWADTNSLYTLKTMLPQLSETNTAFIFSARYEIEEFKDIKEKYHVLKLNTLNEIGAKCLACRLLGCSDIDGWLLDTIIRFTKGSPLYIREFVSNIKRTEKCYIKDGIAYAEKEKITSLPDNIQGLILAELSELDDMSKSFLQAASVEGKDFNLSIVKNLVDYKVYEAAILRMPLQLNIISLKSVYTSNGVIEKIFTFNQDIEREIIYGSILNRNKKALHKKIGEIIESRYSKDIENYYEILSMHFHRAGMLKKAGDYYYKVAIKHKNDCNLNSSLEYYNKFLQVIGEMREGEERSRVVHALRDIGYINFIIANHDVALEYLNKAMQEATLSDDIYSIKIMIADINREQDMYNEALAILEEIQPRIKRDNTLYGRLLQMKCSVLRIMGNPEALSFAKKSEAILLKARDYKSLSETMNQAGILYYTKGDVDNSMFYLNKSYGYAEKINNLEVMAKVSGNLGIICHATGMVSKAQEWFNKSINLSKKISDQQGYATGCINLGILYMDKGMFKRAQELFQESMNISTEIASRLNECICLTNLGDVMYEKGNNGEALDYYRRSIQIAREINVNIGEGINHIGITRIYINTGLYDRVPGMLEMAYKIFNDANEVTYLSDYYRYKSLYEMIMGSPNMAYEYIQKAIEASVECQSAKKKVKALRLKGNILMLEGDYGDAVKVFTEAIELAQQIESDYEAAKGYYRRHEAYSKLNMREEAQDNLARARECISRVDRCRWTDVIM